MAHSALSAFVALASLTLVAGQTTPAPAAPNASPTFPVTPLSNIPVTYSDLVRAFVVNFSVFLIGIFTMFSHTKLSPLHMPVGHSLAITSAIRPLRIRTQSVRPLS